MKKLLTILGSMCLLSGTTTVVVSCGTNKPNPTNNSGTNKPKNPDKPAEEKTAAIENVTIINSETLVANTKNIKDGDIRDDLTLILNDKKLSSSIIAPFCIYSSIVKNDFLIIQLTLDLNDGDKVQLEYKSENRKAIYSEKVTYSIPKSNDNVKVMIATISNDAATINVSFMSPLNKALSSNDIEFFDLTRPARVNPTIKIISGGNEGDSDLTFKIDSQHAKGIGANDNVWVLINGLDPSQNKARPDTMGITNKPSPVDIKATIVPNAYFDALKTTVQFSFNYGQGKDSAINPVNKDVATKLVKIDGMKPNIDYSATISDTYLTIIFSNQQTNDLKIEFLGNNQIESCKLTALYNHPYH